MDSSRVIRIKESLAGICFFKEGGEKDPQQKIKD